MATLLAFDPAAETHVSDTGWAVVQYEDDSPPVLVASGVINGGFQGFLDYARNDRYELTGWWVRPDVVICEQWVDYGSHVDTSPRLIEGVIRYLWPDVALQPSSVLQVVSVDDLRALGWATREGHHQDSDAATRHALYYLRSIRHKPTLRLLSE